MPIPEVVAANEKLRETIQLLRGAGHHGWAGTLERSLQTMNGWYDSKEMLFVAGQGFHSRALGDLVMPGLTWQQWSEHVNELHDLCATAFNVLERLPPERRDEV